MPKFANFLVKFVNFPSEKRSFDCFYDRNSLAVFGKELLTLQPISICPNFEKKFTLYALCTDASGTGDST